MLRAGFFLTTHTCLSRCTIGNVLGSKLKKGWGRTSGQCPRASSNHVLHNRDATRCQILSSQEARGMKQLAGKHVQKLRKGRHNTRRQLLPTRSRNFHTRLQVTRKSPPLMQYLHGSFEVHHHKFKQRLNTRHPQAGLQGESERRALSSSAAGPCFDLRLLRMSEVRGGAEEHPELEGQLALPKDLVL